MAEAVSREIESNTRARAPPAAHNLLMAEYDGGRHAGVVATLAGEVRKGLRAGKAPLPISIPLRSAKPA